MQMIVLENLTKYNEAIKDLVKSGYEYWKILIHREPEKKKKKKEILPEDRPE